MPLAPIPFELFSFLGSSNTVLSWIGSSGFSTDSVTAFSSFSYFINRGKPPNLVIGPLLFNITHSIVSTSTSYSSLHPTLMFSLSSVHVLSLLGHKIWLESSSSLSSLSLPLLNHLICPIFIILNFHPQCHSSYLDLYDTFCLDYYNNFFTDILPPFKKYVCIDYIPTLF